MPLLNSIKRQLRVPFFVAVCLFCSLFALAQVTLTYRSLNGYFLSDDAPINKGKPTLFVFEQADTFGQVLKPATNKRPDGINFDKEMAICITLPPTSKPPKLSVSKVFVQDSTLTIRYIRIADTTTTADRTTNNPPSLTTQPMLLVSIPKQAVLKTRLVENGKVVQTMKKREEQ